MNGYAENVMELRLDTMGFKAPALTASKMSVNYLSEPNDCVTTIVDGTLVGNYSQDTGRPPT